MYVLPLSLILKFVIWALTVKHAQISKIVVDIHHMGQIC